MYIIDYEKLNGGDVILIKSQDSESERIRKLTGSVYSHAMICVGVSACIESDGLGVQSLNPQRKLFENKDDILVLRLKNGIENRAIIIEGAIEYSRSLIGTEYSTSEARKVITGIQNEPLNNRQFCTRLVTRSFYYGGLKILDNIDYPNPTEILESNFFEVKDDLIRKATAEEIEYARSKSLLDNQIEATNVILEQARNITGTDIQNFNQLDNYLLVTQDREFDKQISKIIEDTDFLDLWKKEKENNPYYYDYELFKKQYTTLSRRLVVVEMLSDTYNDLLKRYSVNYAGYKRYYSIFPCTYFNLHIKLYENLLEVNRQRFNVIKLTLEEIGEQP